MRALVTFLLRAVLRVRLRGTAGTAGRAQPVLIVANHKSPLDALLLGLFLPHHPVIIVPPDDAQSGFMRWALRYVAHAVLDVGNPASLKAILKLLRTHRPVVVFPEGRITHSGAVTKVYPVAALAAAKSAAVVVPVHIVGRSVAGRGTGLVKSVCVMLKGVTLHLLPERRIDAAPEGTARQRRLLATRRLTSIMQQATLEAFVCKTLFECFLDACSEHGRNTDLIEDQRQGVQTYGAMLRAGLALGRLFKRATSDNERVGVLLPNVPVTVQTVLALSGAGRVPVMFNYSGGIAAVKAARTAAGVRTVITSRRFIDQARLQHLLDALSGCTIVYLEDLRSQFGLGDKLWLIAFALRFPSLVIARRRTSDPAAVLLTSGSDGEPKAVVLSHQAIVANVVQIRTVMEFTADDKILNPLPLYHAYSFTAGMALSLVTGTRMHLYISPLHYRAIPDIAYRTDCTVLFGTGTFLSYYAAHAHPADFARLRYVISGGEKLAPEVARVWMEKFGLRIFEGYGCTECSPVISLATPAAYRTGTVGRLLPGIDHHIEPVNGIEKGGVLHLRGPNLMLGHYLADKPGALRAARSAHGPGWYDTGDIVEIDDEGYVVIHGRMRRFAKIAGEMVSLDHVEEVARNASPAHFHAAVLKLEEYGGETTVLFTTDPALDRIALQKAARAAGRRDLAVARQIVKVRELPMLPSGKTDYASLARVAESQAPHARPRIAAVTSSQVLQESRSPAAQRPKAAEPALPSGSNTR